MYVCVYIYIYTHIILYVHLYTNGQCIPHRLPPTKRRNLHKTYLRKHKPTDSTLHSCWNPAFNIWCLTSTDLHDATSRMRTLNGQDFGGEVALEKHPDSSIFVSDKVQLNQQVVVCMAPYDNAWYGVVQHGMARTALMWSGRSVVL